MTALIHQDADDKGNQKGGDCILMHSPISSSSKTYACKREIQIRRLHRDAFLSPIPLGF